MVSMRLEVEEPSTKGRITTSPPDFSTTSLPTVVALLQSPPLTRIVGLERGDEFQGGRFIKNRDIIHTPEAGEDFCPLFLREDWPVRAFQTSNRTVTVHSDDQYISERFGFLQIADMADMEKVKTAVGKDDPFSLCLEIVEDPLETFFILDLLLQCFLLIKTYQI